MKINNEFFELEKTLSKLENLHTSFDYLRINIASPKRIKSWSTRKLPSGELIGEILKPETINFRTHQPEINGLFCEKIFGPITNWKCKCGKYNGFLLNKVCEECGVEIIDSRIRRYRMGYIELTTPATHLWYLRGTPNYLLTILRCYNKNLTSTQLENIIYFKTNEETNNTPILGVAENELPKHNELNLLLNKNQIFANSKSEKSLLCQKGPEFLKGVLENLNLINEIKKARTLLDINSLKHFNTICLPDKNLLKQIRILESFIATKTNPSWMILTILPVLPPNLRPLLELENGRLVAADINEIYRLIITRNQRLFDFIYNFIAPEVIIIHGRKLLQESIDSLIDNARLPKDKTFCLNNKALKSLTEILEGKHGRFRQTLLGKRVDYSARSVIIVGPHLRLNQCGIPYEIAVKLFQPFLINKLLTTKIPAPKHNTKLARLIIRKNKPFIWNILKELTKKHSILLNRAPTLHRFGIQTFDPVLVLGQAIHLHPLVCNGFNADFDGDQMAIHLPLYAASQLEAKTLMRPSSNIFSPSNGHVILKPTQDMVIGCYYLTLMINEVDSNLKKWFANEMIALNAFYNKKLTLHTPILVRYTTSNFKIELINNRIKICGPPPDILNSNKEILIYKIFQGNDDSTKFYLISTIGILVAYYIDDTNYDITHVFLETTPGRLIFSNNLKNSIGV
jgi:DNA-directed RNA polymerase subunit beta'